MLPLAGDPARRRAWYERELNRPRKCVAYPSALLGLVASVKHTYFEEGQIGEAQVEGSVRNTGRSSILGRR